MPLPRMATPVWISRRAAGSGARSRSAWPALHAGAQYGDRDAQVLQPPAAGQGGEARGSGGCGDEAAPADHRITLPQSSSK